MEMFKCGCFMRSSAIFIALFTILMRNGSINCSSLNPVRLAVNVEVDLWNVHTDNMENYSNTYCEGVNEGAFSDAKRYDTPVAFIFGIDHGLPAEKLEFVRQIYHSIVCLLPNASENIYAAIVHFGERKKVSYGWVKDIRKLHESLEGSGNIRLPIWHVDPCWMAVLITEMLEELLAKPFFFEKVIRHIILIEEIGESCNDTNIFGGKSSGWILDRIALKESQIHERRFYKIAKGNDFIARIQFIENHYFIDGTRLVIYTPKNEFPNRSLLYVSLYKFLESIFAQSTLLNLLSYGSNKWTKFTMQHFKRVSLRVDPISRWVWILNLLRFAFFVVGIALLILSVCAMCGFSCMISAALKDDFFNRQQQRRNEIELMEIENRFRDHVEDDQNDFIEIDEANEDMNTAIEDSPSALDVSATQASVSEQNTVATAFSPSHLEEVCIEMKSAMSTVVEL